MSRLPGALFVVDIKKEHLAIKEAHILGIPVIAICDTNTDPESVDYPIPANDDSIRAVEIISAVMADAINEGTEISRIRMAELSADSERAAKESDMTEDDDQPKVRRKMRERKGRTDEKPAPRSPKAEGNGDVEPAAVIAPEDAE